MKIAINRCFGGFGLSPKAKQLYLKKIGKECHFYKQTKHKYRDKEDEYKKLTLEEAEECGMFFNVYTKDMGETFSEYDDGSFWYENFYDKKRTDRFLIETIEELGCDVASGQCAKIEIVEIPDGVEWDIDEYDGNESIHEAHRSW